MVSVVILSIVVSLVTRVSGYVWQGNGFLYLKCPCFHQVWLYLKILHPPSFAMCMGVLLEYLSGHHVSFWCLLRPEKGIWSHETGVTCKLPWECWELNPGSPEVQSVVLNHWAISLFLKSTHFKSSFSVHYNCTHCCHGEDNSTRLKRNARHVNYLSNWCSGDLWKWNNNLRLTANDCRVLAERSCIYETVFSSEEGIFLKAYDFGQVSCLFWAPDFLRLAQKHFVAPPLYSSH